MVLNIDTSDYDTLYYYLNESVNTSIGSNLFMLLAVYRYKLCLYNQISVYALLSLNALNIFFLVFPFEYEVYEYYISIFMNGRGVPAQGLLPPGIYGYEKDEYG